MLTLGVETSGTVDETEQVNFSVDTSVCFGYLHVELWDVDRPAPSDADPAVADPMLMVRRAKNPSASYSREDNDWSWSDDTFVDLEGYRLLRAYHRVVVDLRLCSVACAGACAGDDAPTNCQALCLVTCEELEPSHRAEPFKVAVKNVRDWVQESLSFEVRASCVEYDAEDATSDVPPCPRPTASAGECGGKGTCGLAPGFTSGVVNRLKLTSGVCACDKGWGDAGCDQALLELEANAPPVAVTVPVGEWAYYFLDVEDVTHGDDPNVAVLVEMTRTSGDPVLFVKRVDGTDTTSGGGASVKTGSLTAAPTDSGGAMPWVGDYAQFADTNGFRMRLNYHYISLNPANVGKFYVAVFNNDVYLRDSAVVSLSAKTSFAAGAGSAADDPLCPEQCGSLSTPSRGDCLTSAAATGVAVPAVGVAPVGGCRCAEGFAGDACEGTLSVVSVATTSSASAIGGTLVPGEWAYVKFDVDRNVADAGITIRFTHDGIGHPILMLSAGVIPNLLDAHYVLSTTEYLDRRSQFKISARDLNVDTYYVAVFNMNYYRDGACVYQISVESTFVDDGYGVTSPGFMTVVLVVIIGMFACAALTAVRRFLRRAMRQRTLRDVLMGRAPPQGWGDVALGAGAAGGRSGHRPHPGCPRNVVDAIPTIEFGGEAWDAGKWGKEDEACSVCIDSFEVGETLLSLPQCQHAFHKGTALRVSRIRHTYVRAHKTLTAFRSRSKDCIEGWLAQNATCPNCRASLVPVEGGETDVETGNGAARGRPAAQSDAPESPPGVVQNAPTSGDFVAAANEAREDANRGRRVFGGGAPVTESARRATLAPVASRRS